MPHAMSQFGMVLGVLVIVFSGFTSGFGLYLQARCSKYVERGTSSFFALSQLTYPNAAVLFDAAIAIKCFGTPRFRASRAAEQTLGANPDQAWPCRISSSSET